MQHFQRITSSKYRYLITLTAVIIAAGIRYALNPILGSESPLLIFTLPVVLSALYGGFGPALLATCIGGAIGTYLFVGGHGFDNLNLANQVRVVMFFTIGLAISLLGKKFKHSERQAAEAIKQIRQESKRKDEFLAMLGHELRNPLAAISTASALLKFVRPDTERLDQTSEIIGRQVTHMSRLIDDLLDVSRVTRGLVIIDKEPLDLREAVHAAIDQVGLLIQEKHHALTVEVPSEKAWVCGDRTRLIQVVGNLINNAAKYTPPGGNLLVRIGLHKETVELSVQDNGIGIDADLLPQVFDLFVQAVRTSDRSQGGLGIGLALVKSLVELHQGTVRAYSEGAETGSTFTICLPRHTGRTEKPVEPVRFSAIEENAGKSLTILVVDDNKDAALTLAQLLESQGHMVFVEYDAKGALNRVHEEELDVLLLDIGLPEIDGYQLCQRLRLIPHLYTATFIAITGYGQKTDKDRASDAGFAHHLVKPVKPSELMALLATV